ARGAHRRGHDRITDHRPSDAPAHGSLGGQARLERGPPARAVSAGGRAEPQAAAGRTGRPPGCVASQRNRADRSPGAGRPGRTHRRSGGPPPDVCAADLGGRKAPRRDASPGTRMAAQDCGRSLDRGAGAAATCLSPIDRQHDRRAGSREEERMSETGQRNPSSFTDSSGHLTEGLTRWRTIAVVAGTMLALLLAALDQTIVGTAMPRIVAELNGLSYYSWVITAYLVASTIMVPIAGKLGDLF